MSSATYTSLSDLEAIAVDVPVSSGHRARKSIRKKSKLSKKSIAWIYYSAFAVLAIGGLLGTSGISHVIPW